MHTPSPSAPPGGLGLVRATPTSSLKVVPSDADSSAYYANATVIDVRDHQQRHRDRELRHHNNKESKELSLDSPSLSRRKPRLSLGIVASCPRRGKRMRKSSLGNATLSSFAQRATLHSPSETNRRAGAVDPGRLGCVDLPALVPEPSSRVLAGGGKKVWTNDAYYKNLDYCCEESEPVTGKEGGWEGTGGGVAIVSPPLEETSLQSVQGESPVFRRVEIRAAWRECQGKSLRRSAAPIVDLVALVIPLLLIVGFSLTT